MDLVPELDSVEWMIYDIKNLNIFWTLSNSWTLLRWMKCETREY